MSSEHIALITLSGTLLATLVVQTWRFSALATRLLTAVQRLEDKEKEQDGRLRLLDEIPAIRSSVAHLERNHSLIPRLETRLGVLEERITSLQRNNWRRSRPEEED